ncbi:MAG: hypothetical protein AB7G13_33645 [Lautropia sp.]
MMDAWRNDRFAPAARAALLPLAIWAAHFIGCYAMIAAGCTSGLADLAFAAVPLLRLLLLAVTVLAILWLAVLLPGAWRRRDRARWAFAGLALIAIVWTLPGLATLPLCGR